MMHNKASLLSFFFISALDEFDLKSVTREQFQFGKLLPYSYLHVAISNNDIRNLIECFGSSHLVFITFGVLLSVLFIDTLI